MRFVRPVTAQNYLQGKSLGHHRGFPSLRSIHNGTDVFDKAMNVGKYVLGCIYQYSVGAAFGAGCGYLITGTNTKKLEKFEKKWWLRELDLQKGEAKVEELREFYEFHQKLDKASRTISS